jgi:enoyl-CoA hydratase/carnithine racemase
MGAEVSYTVSLDRSADGRIAWLRFASDTKLNSLTFDMVREMHDHMLALIEKDRPRVLVISGRPDMFTGGADLNLFVGDDEAAFRSYVDQEYDVFRQLETLPFMTIASIGGLCIGNGAELALCCDLRIGTESSRISFAESKIGFDAPAQRLARYVGIGRAKEILFSGRMIGAQEADALGLLTRLVADDALASGTEALAKEYAAMAPLALRLTKENIDAAYGMDRVNFTAERQAACTAFRSDDRREGMQAVFERRAPQFTGK